MKLFLKQTWHGHCKAKAVQKKWSPETIQTGRIRKAI
jgi:hypothetical protein